MSRQYDLFRHAVERVQEVRDRAVTDEIMRDCYQFGKGGTYPQPRATPNAEPLLLADAFPLRGEADLAQ